MELKSLFLNHLKNIPGWRSDRKLVIFAVDDYGIVRTDSLKARENLVATGMGLRNHFNAFDSLESQRDLEALFEVLTSVKDRHGHPAVFTPYALPCNIDFEAMAQEGYQRYIPQTVRETFQRQAVKYPEAYNVAWELLAEGMNKGLMAP